jgi:hypothetical protein
MSLIETIHANIQSICANLLDFLPNILGSITGLYAGQRDLKGFANILGAILVGILISYFGGDLVADYYHYDTTSKKANSIEFLIGVFGLTFLKLAFSKLPFLVDTIINKFGK